MIEVGAHRERHAFALRQGDHIRHLPADARRFDEITARRIAGADPILRPEHDRAAVQNRDRRLTAALADAQFIAKSPGFSAILRDHQTEGRAQREVLRVARLDHELAHRERRTFGVSARARATESRTEQRGATRATKLSSQFSKPYTRSVLENVAK